MGTRKNSTRTLHLYQLLRKNLQRKCFLFSYIYIHISATVPRSTRWSVHNVFKGSLSWCPGVEWGLFKGTPPPPGHAFAWLFAVLAAPYLELFFDTSPEPRFSTFGTRSLPKWNPNESKIRRKLVPRAFQKNIFKTVRFFFIFLLLSKRWMFPKHCKLQYKTTFFLAPRLARHLQKNIETPFENHTKIL